MKRTNLAVLLILFSGFLFAQTDTIYTLSKSRISCKIVEIGEIEFRYTLPDLSNGPVYVISAAKVLKYKLANGQEVIVAHDELLVENKHNKIMNCRSVFKVHPFSYVNNKIGVAFEYVLEPGNNLDLELGYIDNDIMPFTNTDANLQTIEGRQSAMSGFYFKPGLKYLVGQDFSLKGMRQAHPLKGRFILINLVTSYLRYQDAYFYVSQSRASGGPAGNYDTLTDYGKIADVNCIAYGLMINYGRQFILSNAITLEYYVGLGATGQIVTLGASTPISNKYLVQTSYSSRYRGVNSDRSPDLDNFYGFFRVPNIGISYTLGFRLGILLPESKRSSKKEVKPVTP